MLVVAGTLVAFTGLRALPAAAATGPASWHQQSSGSTADLHSVAFLVPGAPGDAEWVVVGDHGTVLTKTVQGQWTPQVSGTTENLRAVIGSYGVVGTTNPPTAACPSGGPRQLCLWAAGDHGTILFSSDLGAHWCAQAPGTTANLRGIQSLGGPVVAVGPSGVIVRANSPSTCASTYAPEDGGTTANLNGMGGASGAGAVGSGGTMIVTGSAQGSSWTPVATGTTADLYAIGGSFTGAPGGGGPGWDVISGAGGFVSVGQVDATSGNVSFTAENSGTVENLRGVSLDPIATSSNPSHPSAWAVGDHGTIRYRDGASTSPTWISVDSPVVSDLRSVSDNGGSGLIVGAAGTILVKAPAPPPSTTTSTSTPTSTSSTTTSSTSTTVPPTSTSSTSTTAPPASTTTSTTVRPTTTTNAPTTTTLLSTTTTAPTVGIHLTIPGGSLLSGQSLTITGRGFGVNVTLTLTFHSQDVDLGTVTTDATGAFTKTVIVPDVDPGAHTISVAGTNGERASINVTVAGSPSVSPELPRTGGNLRWHTAIGGAVIALGVLLLLAGRRSGRMLESR